MKNKLLWKVEEMMKTKQTDELLAKDEQYVWHGMRPFSPNSTMVGAKAHIHQLNVYFYTKCGLST
ncbi:hypothetical protein LKL82_27350, partial [Bacillus pacificus]|nr:hypothetical protein [Bacillus pacificus]